eukprot:798849-Pyramimonas_sp.AAC.1
MLRSGPAFEALTVKISYCTPVVRTTPVPVIRCLRSFTTSVAIHIKLNTQLCTPSYCTRSPILARLALVSTHLDIGKRVVVVAHIGQHGLRSWRRRLQRNIGARRIT